MQFMKKLVALIFCAFFLLNITPSFAQTGTCECILKGYDRTWSWEVDQSKNYCDKDTQKASGCVGDSNYTLITDCTCVAADPPVPTPVLPWDSCLCKDDLNPVAGENCRILSKPECICSGGRGGGNYCSCSCRAPAPTSPPIDLNDCACNTSTVGGVKTCKPAQGTKCAQGKVPVCQFNPDGGCNHALLGGGACVCKKPGVIPITNEDGNFCTQQGFGALTSDPRVDTALGCIPVKMDKFIAWLLPVLFSISGGIAFLLMVYGFILITTSKGDPKAIQGARETITSAIVGLLISIFAIFILRLIAVDILHIPGIS